MLGSALGLSAVRGQRGRKRGDGGGLGGLACACVCGCWCVCVFCVHPLGGFFVEASLFFRGCRHFDAQRIGRWEELCGSNVPGCSSEAPEHLRVCPVYAVPLVACVSEFDAY